MLTNIKKRNNDQKGFTIIEVLIVLAIAGLILLIVFLAVPALQRSSRNTQRKNDASAIASAVANFISNNGGSLPTSKGVDSGDANSVDLCAGATCPTTTANFETAKLGYYTPAQVSFIASTASAKETSPTAVEIDPGYGCNPTNTGASAVNNTRTAAILYATEQNGTSATGSSQCVEQ